MKKRCSADKYFFLNGLIIGLLILEALFCLSACRTSSGAEHDEIVKTSIDLAQRYFSQGNYEKALEIYDKALSLAEDYRLFYNMAIVLSSLGRNREAALLCESSFENFPYILSFKKAQAFYLSLAGENEASRKAYIEILDLNPYDTEIRISLIKAYMSAGLEDKAYEMALILWNQGYRNLETVKFLYEIRPEEWKEVYTALQSD